jgi:hypothetical protein
MVVGSRMAAVATLIGRLPTIPWPLSPDSGFPDRERGQTPERELCRDPRP